MTVKTHADYCREQNRADAIGNMADILGKLDATYTSSEHAIASYLLNNLKGSHADKVELITTVLQAYAKMLQDAGVKV